MERKTDGTTAGTSRGSSIHLPSALHSRHLIAILAVLALAATLAAPRWWLLSTSPDEGQRVQVDPGGTYGIGWDEALYAPLIRQAFDGDVPVRDSYVFEHRDDPPLTFGWWQSAIGTLGRATGGDIFVALALAHTTAVGSGLVLMYALGWRLTGSRIAAAAWIPIAMLLAQVLYQAQGFWALRHGYVITPLLTLDPPGEFHTWYRYLAPSIALPVTFGTLLAVKEAVEQRRRAWQVAAAVGIALLIYTNPFFWTTILLGLGLWCVWLALDRDWDTVRLIAGIVAIGIALAIPEVVILIWNALEVPRSVQTRAGLGSPGFETEFAGIVIQRLLFIAPFAWFALRGPTINRLWIALAVSPLLLALTSGLVPQVDHYLYQAWVPCSMPLVLAGALEAITALTARQRQVAVGAVAVLAACAAVYIAAFQVRATQALDQDYAVSKDEFAALAWIRDNLDEDEVVVSPSRSTNYLLASLTPVYVYVPYGSSAVGTRASEAEIMDRYFRASAAFGYSIDDTMYRLDPAHGIPRPERDDDIDGGDVQRYVERSMIDYLLNELVDRPGDIRDRLPGWRSEYGALNDQQDVLSPYRATHLYCGPRERLWDGDGTLADIWVLPAFSSDSVAVYEIVDADTAGGRLLQGCTAATAVKVSNP